MSKISNDLIAGEDTLSRRPFAKNIVLSLVNSFEQIDDSVVVGICGKWGSGKSTLISYIESEIREYYQSDISKYKIIQFNSWANSNEKDLQRALLEVILKRIEKENWKKTIKTASEKIKKYLRYLEYVKYLKYAHPVILNWFNGIEQFRKKNEVISIDELKASVNELIRANGIKLYITIDDLDRLDHNEIVSVFKALKLSVNFINTVFFVAYDKEVVVNALKDTYGSNAEEYLEKIIQVDFSVPELLDEQVENIFFDKISGIIKSCQIEVNLQEVFSLWKYYGLRQLFQNPRDVKRYANSLILSLPNVKNNVNILDFFALEAIKVFDYNSYALLYENLLEFKRASVIRSVDIKKEYLDKFENNTTKVLIDYLFGIRAGQTSFNSALIDKRLKDTEFFQRYFTLSISSKDITEEELMSYVIGGTSKRQILQTAYENGRIKNLLRRLGDKNLKEKLPLSDESVFREFLNFWEENKDITSELDELIWHAYFNMAHSFIEPIKGAKLAVDALEIGVNSLQPMRLVFNHFIFRFKRDGRTDSELYGVLNDELINNEDRLFTAFKQNMEKLYGSYFHKINSGRGDYACLVFIDSFATYYPVEYMKEAKRAIDSTGFVLFILKYFMLRIDAVSNKPFGMNMANNNIVLPGTLFDDFLSKLKVIKLSLVSEEEKELIKYFNENNIL